MHGLVALVSSSLPFFALVRLETLFLTPSGISGLSPTTRRKCPTFPLSSFLSCERWQTATHVCTTQERSPRPSSTAISSAPLVHQPNRSLSPAHSPLRVDVSLILVTNPPSPHHSP